MIMGVAANVPRAARSRADIVQRLFHRGDYLGMLAHAQIVVRAPYRDGLWSVMPGKAARIGKFPFVAQNVDENTVASLGMKPVNRLVEYCVVIHRVPPLCRLAVALLPPITTAGIKYPARTIRNKS